MATLDELNKQKLSSLNLTDPIALGGRNIGWMVYDAQGNFIRKEPKVATAATGVTTLWGSSFQYDAKNPQDYIFNIKAKQLAGKNLSQDEYYNYLKATDAANKATLAVSPYWVDTQYYKDLVAQQEVAKKTETSSDAAAIDAFQKAKFAEYNTKIKNLEQQGVKQQQAAQKVLSFSWFGRSTAAAQQQSDIQASTNEAVNNSQAARDAEIAKYKAEMEWADSDTLQAINTAIEKYNTAAQDRQLASLKSTAEANQKNAVTFEDALNNLGKSANASWIDVWDSDTLSYYGSLVRNADGSVNEEKLATIPENVQALVRLAAQSSIATETPKIQQIWKNQYGYFDAKGNLIRVNGWSGWTGSWSWSGWGWLFWPIKWYKYEWAWANGQLTAQQANERNDLLARVTRIADLAKDPVKRAAAMTTGFGSTMNDLKFIRSNLWFDKLVSTKKQWATYGALSEGEWNRIDAAASSLPQPWKISSATVWTDAVLRDLNTVLEAAWYTQRVSAAGSASPKEETPAPAAVKYKQTATWPNGQKMWTIDWVNRVPIK
jgi:hypothetical protein